MSKPDKRKPADKRKPVKDLKGIWNGPYSNQPAIRKRKKKKFKAARCVRFEVYDVGELVVVSLPTSKLGSTYCCFEAQILSLIHI